MQSSSWSRLIVTVTCGCTSVDSPLDFQDTATLDSLPVHEEWERSANGAASPATLRRERANMEATAPSKPTSDVVCESTESAAACFVCCEDTHPSGLRVQAEALRACACTPSRCAAECAGAYCTENGDASPSCRDCVDGVLGECTKAVDARCREDASCRALEACVAKHRCDEKP